MNTKVQRTAGTIQAHALKTSRIAELNELRRFSRNESQFGTLRPSARWDTRTTGPGFHSLSLAGHNRRCYSACRITSNSSRLIVVKIMS
jgi:hypothetical protein